jgi:hypothetical protein
MAVPSLDIEFSKFWTQLTFTQKQSLLNVIKSFVNQSEIEDVEKYNQELNEAESEYSAGHYITQEEMLKLISTW